MRPLPLALAIFLGILGIAWAAQAEEFTLTNAAILDIQAGLGALGGMHESVTKEGSVERIARVPYRLRAAVVDAISRNIVALKPVNDALDMTRNSLVQQAQALPEGKARDEAMARVSEEFRGVLLQTRRIELERIDPKDLGREPPVENPIPAIVLAQLAPILVEAKK